MRTTILPPAKRGWRPDTAGVLLALSTAITVLAFILCNAGCAGWQAPPAVSIAGSATNAATAVLVSIESMQGDAELAAGRDPEATVAPKWAAFWKAWAAWVDAQRAWADAYERGASDAAQLEAAARAAFCAARNALPPEVPREVVVGVGLACVVLPLPQAPAVLPMADAGTDGGDGGR